MHGVTWVESGIEGCVGWATGGAVAHSAAHRRAVAKHVNPFDVDMCLTRLRHIFVPNLLWCVFSAVFLCVWPGFDVEIDRRVVFRALGCSVAAATVCESVVQCGKECSDAGLCWCTADVPFDVSPMFPYTVSFHV